MILVAAGTHHQPFDRLVAAAEALARAIDEPVVLQRGASRRAAPACEVHDQMPPEVFDAQLAAARIVVLHGGSSSFLQARSHGHTPIVVPRRPEHREHVDDHQVRFAASLGDEAVVTDPGSVVATVRAWVGPGGDRVVVDPDARSRLFGQRLGRILGALVS